MATIVEYYEVMYDSGFEISGANYVCAKFLSLSAAEEYAKLEKFRYVCKTKKRIVVYDTVKDLELHKRQDLKETALKKLTPEERLILGV